MTNTPELNAWIDVHRTCVREQLPTLDVRRRTVFATSCAERFIWCFLNDTRSERQEDRRLVRHSLDSLWAALAEHRPFDPNGDLDRLNAMPELSSDDEEPPGFAAFQGDALAILAYALDSAKGDAEAGRWAAQHAFDTANFADDEPSPEPTGVERSYTLTFRELRYQLSDIALVKCLPNSDWSLVRWLRQESEDYGQQFYADIKKRSS